MHVLIMGGTQFNGLAVVRELARHGHRLTLLNRGRTEADLPRGIERLTADRNNADAMRTALAGRTFDAVIDVSAYTPAHVELMIELLGGRVGHYVFISSTVIYAASNILPIGEDFALDDSPRQNEYARNKIACERLLTDAWRQSGFPMTVVALSMVFGPRNIVPDRELRMFDRLASNRPILIPGDGTVLCQVGQVDDQARALRTVLGRNVTFGRRYNLSGADAVSAEGYVDVCAASLGVTPEKVFVPAAVMDAAFDGKLALRPNAQAPQDWAQQPVERLSAANQWQLSALVQHVAPHIHRWNRSVVFGIDRLREDVGWTPEYSFTAAVEQFRDWYTRAPAEAQTAFDYTFEDELLAHVRGRKKGT